LNTEELVRMAQKGNHQAFCQLVEERKESIYRIAYSYVRNKEDALDIVSESVYKAYVSIGHLQNPRHFQTWFTRILINNAINHIQKNKKLFPLDEGIAVKQQAGSVSSEETIDLYRAIDGLPAKERMVIILMYVEGFTLTEIADLLKCPLGTVKTRLNRALKTLRAILQEV
jgi:RNA polymerase sigma-70 factor, ECF subfamily